MYKASVVIITYKHEEFISQAINGVLMQQCDFPVELIIGNDNSPDRTDEIIKDIIESYSGNIKIRYDNHAQNLGMIPNFISSLKKATGEYIAICEGDDYWTDPFKLQRQVNFLEDKQEYSLIAENSLVINTINGNQYNFNDIDECDINLTDLLVKRQFSTASTSFRSKYLDNDFYQVAYSGDTFLWCYLATKGKIKYLNIISSVYTRGLQGIVESTSKIKWAKMMEIWNKNISQILPSGYDRKILKERNYNEFSAVFLVSTEEKNIRYALFSLLKCFRYQPLKTVKMIIVLSFERLKHLNILSNGRS